MEYDGYHREIVFKVIYKHSGGSFARMIDSGGPFARIIGGYMVP